MTTQIDYIIYNKEHKIMSIKMKKKDLNKYTFRIRERREVPLREMAFSTEFFCVNITQAALKGWEKFARPVQPEMSEGFYYIYQ